MRLGPSLAIPAIRGPVGVPLAAPSFLSPLLTLTRAQASGARSTALNADSTTWAEYAADVPRFHGSARRLLIGGQRTNSVRNARLAGATAGVIGSGGVAPTNCTFTVGAGLSTEIVGTGTNSGIQYCDVRYFGTATATQTQRLYFEATTAIAAAVSQTWAAGVFLAVVAGTAPQVSSTIGERDAGGSILAANDGTLQTLGASLVRYSQVATLAQATTAFLTPGFRWVATLSTVYDFTLRIGWPTVEQATFASTPILPASGTPAASTRGGDIITAALAALGITGPHTVLYSGLIPNTLAATGTIFQIDDGTTNNRYVLNVNTSNALFVNRTLAGATSSLTCGTMTPNTLFAVGYTVDAAGRMAGSFNGGAIGAVTGGPTSGLTTFRLGGGNTGVTTLFGETARLSILPYALSDAALQAAVAAFPTS